MIQRSLRKHKYSLLVFIKNPEKGKVKTRLAQSVGDDKALEIYKRLLQHTRKITLQVDASRYLFYSQEIKEDDWSSTMFNKKLQIQGDLGDKMNHAFSVALKESSAAVIIGSDCAQLDAVIIQEAFQMLESHDVVIGPTLDGGYYLLGMRALHTKLFIDMPWSTSEVYRKTKQCLKDENLSMFELQTLSDIDYIEDWNRYGLDDI